MYIPFEYVYMETYKYVQYIPPTLEYSLGGYGGGGGGPNGVHQSLSIV